MLRCYPDIQVLVIELQRFPDYNTEGNTVQERILNVERLRFEVKIMV